MLRVACSLFLLGLVACSGAPEVVPELDTDNDGVADSADACPLDASKSEEGVCGCGVVDVDADGDTVADCVDLCAAGDDRLDADEDGIPDACDVECERDSDCADSRTCVTRTCEANVCVTRPNGDCDWPAESAAEATSLTDLRPGDDGFEYDLSGAHFNPVTRTLWLCRNGPTNAQSGVWAVVETPTGWALETRNGEVAEWRGLGDLEGVTQADFEEADTVYGIFEGEEKIKELDLSVSGVVQIVNEWNTRPYLPLDGGWGAEGIAFVPDRFLVEQGFRNEGGVLYTSTGGMGGIMLVGHQKGGRVYAFDLDRSNGTFVYVGAYKTQSTLETSGIEFDRSDGTLWLWHGAGRNRLEAARLSVHIDDEEWMFDAIATFGQPDPPGVDRNHEGIALIPSDECVDDARGLFMTTDGGLSRSLLWYRRFPCTLEGP